MEKPESKTLSVSDLREIHSVAHILRTTTPPNPEDDSNIGRLERKRALLQAEKFGLNQDGSRKKPSQ